MNRGAGLLVACVAAAAGACAGSPPRVWTVAHRTLPAGVDRAIYANLPALRGSRAEGWIYRRAARIMNLEHDAGTEVRRLCKMDPSTTELVLATEGYRQAVVFAHVPGRDEREITACAEKLLHAKASRSGRVIQLHSGDLLVGEMLWVTPQVFAFVVGMPDREALLRLAGGGGGLEKDGAFAEGLVSIEYSSPVWGVMVPSSGSEARGAVSFQVELVGDQVGVEVRVPAGNMLRAWGMARSITRMLARWQDQVSASSAAAEGNDVVIQLLLSQDQIDHALERMLD